ILEGFDGTTLNTKAFQEAINHLSKYESKGGSILYVPPGKWLTGSFNITSVHFTLFLHQDSVLLASQGEMAPLMVKAVCGGANFTKEYTCPCLIEILYYQNIQISNVTLVNSPPWNIHPTYSGNVIVQGDNYTSVTSPTTDGINPDFCTNVRIEDCYIVSGDDCVAVKSGWDEYGIVLGCQPSKTEDIVAINTESGVRIKISVGRGGYVKDIYVRGMSLKTMIYVFWMTGNYGAHPDNNYDSIALPVIQNINYRDIVAKNVTMPALLEGIPGDTFTGICISKVTIELLKAATNIPWNCTDVSGISSDAPPQPCDLLPDQGEEYTSACDFPTESLPIDEVEIQTYSCKTNILPND
ncbi:hypothetical protein ACH5RR_041626, partial [Cinchona calisaya]